LTHHQWRQAWLIKQLSVLERARQELVDEVALATATHPYARIIESLPVKSPIWTATLIGAIGDVSRFSNVNQFKAYLGWSPQLTRSGSSIDHSELAKTGVRPARNVLGQMTVLMLSSRIKATPFREVYHRLTGGGMRPASALGHVAGKLSVVLYGMLKNMTPYDRISIEGNWVWSIPLIKQTRYRLTSPWSWSTWPNHRTISSLTIKALPLRFSSASDPPVHSVGFPLLPLLTYR
jgi:hypothetical protein